MNILFYKTPSLLRSRFLGCHATLPSPKETAAHNRTTFLSFVFVVVSSLFLGGALRDIPRNGCEGD